MTAHPLSLELEPDESIVWSGQPLPAQLARQSVRKALFGLVFVVFVPLWMWMVVRGGNNKWDQGKPVQAFAIHNVLIAAGAGLWFLPIGIYMLLSSLLARRHAMETEYALTNRRALIIRPTLFGGHRIQSFPPERLAHAEYKQRADGSGDIVFESRIVWNGMKDPVGFMAMEQARVAETLIRKLVASDGSIETAGNGAVAARSRFDSFPQSYSVPANLRFGLGFMWLAFSLVTLVQALWLIGFPVGMLLGWFPNTAVIGSALGGVFAFSLVGLMPSAIIVRQILRLPIEIEIDDERTIFFKGTLGTRSVPAAEIISIRTGGWLDLTKGYVRIQHKQGRIFLVNFFPDFGDFLTAVNSLNPAIDIRGF